MKAKDRLGIHLTASAGRFFFWWLGVRLLWKCMPIFRIPVTSFLFLYENVNIEQTWGREGGGIIAYISFLERFIKLNTKSLCWPFFLKVVIIFLRKQFHWTRHLHYLASIQCPYFLSFYNPSILAICQRSLSSVFLLPPKYHLKQFSVLDWKILFKKCFLYSHSMNYNDKAHVTYQRQPFF